MIAATGTGKTVVAAFDFKRFFEQKQKQAKLLFVAHRQEILQQAQATFANVLRDQNFGELLVGQFQANRLEHLFCSVGMLTSRRLWEQVGSGFYDYIVVDEAHHAPTTVLPEPGGATKMPMSCRISSSTVCCWMSESVP